MTAQDSILYDSINFNAFDSLLQFYTIEDVRPVEEYKLKSIEKASYIADWTFIAITLIFLLLAWIRSTSEKYFISVFQSTFNYQTANRLYREHSASHIHATFYFDVLFLLVAGIFVLHFEHQVFNSLPVSDFIFLLINIGAIFLFVYGKYFLYQLTGFLFKNENETNEFIFYLKSGNRILGIFLLPFAVFLFFTSENIKQFALILGLIIIVFFSVIGLFRGLRIIAKKDFSIYYLILYLCTLEILPLLIVWRILW